MRVTGNSLTEPIRPVTRMITGTANPIGTLFSVWYASRHNDLVTPEDAQQVYEGSTHRSQLVEQAIAKAYPEYSTAAEAVLEVARMAVLSNVPAGESVTMTFAVDNCSVALREQIVRSKLSSYWTQTSRTADLRTMDVNRSQSVYDYGGEEAVYIYDNAVESIRSAYSTLSSLGVPMEEIRLAPEARTHRIMWMTDLRSLRSVINKRVDWMAQTTLWSPVVQDIIQQLRSYDPGLHSLFGRPTGVTIKDGHVVDHAYNNENEDRYYGRDPQPCDPLWLAWRGLKHPEDTNVKLYRQMKWYYSQLWDNEVLRALGWSRSHPGEVGPYDV